ncbi:5607_t:CDS:2, partial [Gigaspora rosea]
ELEKILKKKKENQKKFLDKLKKFPEIKDSLTYITIGHLSKEKELKLGAQRKRHDWESVEDDPTTILLDKTNFPEEMDIHFAAAHNGGIGQGNLICQNADGRSRQVSFRLWFDKVFITPKMIKEKQK